MTAPSWNDSQVRVYTLLVRLAQQSGSDMLTLSRRQIAQAAGLTEVTAKKAMDRLEQRGLVLTQPRTDGWSPNVFRLIDRNGLAVLS